MVLMKIVSFIIIIIIRWKMKNDWNVLGSEITSLNGINVKSNIERERVKTYSWWESKNVRGRDGK